MGKEKVNIPLAFEMARVSLAQSIFHPNGAFLSVLLPALICVLESDAVVTLLSFVCLLPLSFPHS